MELRREIIDMMLYWQKMGVGGFRVDAIGNLKKSPKVFEHKPLPTDGTDGMAAIDPYVLLQDGIEDFLGELKREVFDKYDMMTVAEVSVPEDKVEQYTGENGLFSMVFDFTYTESGRPSDQWSGVETPLDLWRAEKQDHDFSGNFTETQLGKSLPGKSRPVQIRKQVHSGRGSGI